MTRNKILTLFILVIAIMVRLPLFGQLPAGLNRDEAALGYNAFSLLRTGKDEHGVSVPISIASFGDQKLPGYVYFLTPFIAALGLTNEVIRIPSFLAGIAVILLMGRLSWLIFTQTEKQKSATIPFLVMLFLAVSPWANHFSRVAYEAHLALAFFLGGSVTLLEALLRKNHRFWIILSATCFSVALATYHSYHVLIPLFVLGISFLFRDQIRKLDKLGVGTGIAIGAITLILLWHGGVWKANQTKFAGISPFSTDEIQERYFLYRQAIPGNSFVEKLVANQLIEKIDIFSQHVVETFSSDFLFTSTTSHRVHNQSGIGNFHLFLAPLLLVGFASLWQLRQKKYVVLLFIWLAVGLIAPSLTISPQHTVRLSPIFPLLELIGALGAVTLWEQIRSKAWKTTVLAIFTGLLILTNIRYLTQYFVLAPERDRDDSHQKWHTLAAALGKYQNQADELVTQSPSSSPYIWYLMVNRIEPQVFFDTVTYYPVDKEGFLHIRKIGNITFETIQWDDIFARAKDHSMLLFLTPTEIDENNLDPRLSVIDRLTDNFGETAYLVVEVKL